MKTFKVTRRTGCEYQGAIFDDGVTVIHWVKSTCPATTIFPSFEVFKEVYLDQNPDKHYGIKFND